MNWYEFFAGGGMARLGLGEGWECRFANEWSAKKAEAYRRRFGGDELRVCDIASLNAGELPPGADLAWASFPCQDLSLAGSGAGLSGARSGTFHAFWDLMEELTPRVVVLENVVGAITSHGGRDFATILGRMATAGYRFGPVVLDAVHWVPQSRPRLFIIGTRDQSRDGEGAVGFGHPRSLIDAHAALDPCLRERWIWWQLAPPPKRTVQLCDLLEHDACEWHSADQTRHILSLMSDRNRRKVDSAKPGSVGTVYRRTREGRQRAEARFDGISGCLRTPAGGSSRQTVLVVGRRGVRTRLLTAREAARLMGVPDDYPLPPRYNDAYHLFGDGLAVPVVSYLERELLRGLVTPSS